MKLRIVRKEGVYYVQRLQHVTDVSGMLDMSRDEWVFEKEFLFFKRKFWFKEDAEAYIKSIEDGCTGYEVI